ncbi:ABC transporter permease [Acaryochloris sp. IP29b_bin.148]|uniref:ABC transporter permease n=1 Tax=Acaryochloris sp. IP29b_bin.148 TaxID=2969218 RepID=UPI00261E966A|nr:ABC transporter permease [Acaryochloris sp. IP29b_bin.148]
MNPQRIAVIASNVFRDIFRDRVLYLAGLYAIGLVLIILFLGEVSAGTEGKISVDVGLASISILTLAVAAFEGGGLINKEVEKRTALILIAKPLSRSEFVLGKHLGLSGVLALLIAIMTTILVSVLSWQQFSYNLNNILLSNGFLILEMALIAAVSILFGAFTSSLMGTVLTFAVYFMGHFSQNLLALSESIEAKSLQQIAKGIYLIFPDLSRLDLKNQAVHVITVPPPELAMNVVYGLVYIVLLLAISIIIFANREF